MSALTLARWIHVIAAAAWLGEVVAVVFLLVPTAASLKGEDRARFIAKVFPRVFRLASVLAIITLLAGAWLNYLLTGWENLEGYFTSTRGLPILVGGSLGLLLALFHFTVEGRLEPRVRFFLEQADERQLDRVSRFLTLVPRIGLAVLVAVFILMMVGARGI